jgi:hypothetical protein
MARGGTSGDWLLAQELFERGDPAFVDELRRVDNAESLGAFAQRWLADPRPEARAFLFEYLDRPLNAFRHEALVKRLFKRAEAAGDDELMANFLVVFDRCVRRSRSSKHHYEAREFDTLREANELAEAWRGQGFASVNVWQNWRKKYQVYGTWFEPTVVVPRTTVMPRGAPRQTYGWDPDARKYLTFSVPDWVLKLKLDQMTFRRRDRVPDQSRKDLLKFRLFSMATRNYLRRRAWRYFRKLGRRQPERYVAAVSHALILYRDEDVADGLALIDNWGLVHILFHFSPALVADERGWRVAPGQSLAALEPAPMHATLWAAAHRALVDLLLKARCRPVRSWATRMIRRDLAAVAAVIPLEERLGLLGHDDSEVVALAADLIRDDPGLKEIPPERWLALVEGASPASLEVLAEMTERYVPPERVSVAQAVRLAMSRPLPLARLGFRWLQTKTLGDEEECRALLGLVEAESEPLRPEIVRWARGVLSKSDRFEAGWVLEWLDSRHEDVRAEGWAWFRAEPRVRDDVALWQRLLETPYDDVRSALVTELGARSRGGEVSRLERGELDDGLLRLLWASVLLNVHRGGRAKPLVVRQLVRRVEARPDDLPRLLPLLAVALRSVRGPEFRSGLAAVVGLATRDEAAAGLVRGAFPELQWA